MKTETMDHAIPIILARTPEDDGLAVLEVVDLVSMPTNYVDQFASIIK